MGKKLLKMSVHPKHFEMEIKLPKVCAWALKEFLSRKFPSSDMGIEHNKVDISVRPSQLTSLENHLSSFCKKYKLRIEATFPSQTRMLYKVYD